MGNGLVLILLLAVVFFILWYNKQIDNKKFFRDMQPFFAFLKEDDYDFLLKLRYGDDIDTTELFNRRVWTALLSGAITFLLIVVMNGKTLYYAFPVIVAFLMFKSPYNKIKNYYKRNLNKINQLLPYYLKSLEILVQHYTVPVALRRSISTAPSIFRDGLERMINRIEEGDSSVDPYMDFAKEYPVRDSMRMMRLLYRLGLGSQENKQEQLLLFSKTVSSLQNKAREQKYKERLESMENQTMTMLIATGAGILMLLLLSMMQMIGV